VAEKRHSVADPELAGPNLERFALRALARDHELHPVCAHDHLERALQRLLCCQAPSECERRTVQAEFPSKLISLT